MSDTRIYLLFALLLSGCASVPYDEPILQRWNEDKAALGPTFAGGPAWHAHMDFVEGELAKTGVVEVQKHPAPYRRWWAADDPSPSERSLIIGGQSLPVASYWAYSGSTPVGGISAPLIIYNKALSKADLAGHIVVFEVEPAPASMAGMFKVGHEYATADFAVADNVIADRGISDDQWYQGNYVTRFGRFDNVLRDSGAAGAVVIFAMSAERLAGLYTFPLLNTGVVGVPGIYVDQLTGETVRAAAEQGSEARLTLLAQEQDVAPYFYTAVLPGKDYATDKDEQILLVTHSDGPNLTQENGTLGILALVRHFAQVPQAQRNKSLRVLLDPQHYSPGRHTIDWYAKHPDIMSRVVASLGVEHLGQREYGEVDLGEGRSSYGLTGRPEPWLIYVRDDPELIEALIAAVEEASLPLTEIRVPGKKGAAIKQGRWIGLGEVALKHDLDGYGTLSGMSGYWGTSAGIESFDAQLATRQLDVLVQLIETLSLR